VTVTPSTGLADRQRVSVTGSGFAPNVGVLAAQCSVGGDGGVSEPGLQFCGFVAFFNAGPDGTLHATMQVHRFLGGPGGFDCASAAGACALIFSDDGLTPAAEIPLAFDPDAPPIPPPVMEANPTTGLVDGSVVTVTGSGFAPHEQVALIQCRDQQGRDDSGQGCALPGGLQYARADEAGNVAATYTVRRFIDTQKFGTVDCTDVDGCILGWGGLADLANERGSFRLTFATGGSTAAGDAGAGGSGTPLAFTGSPARPLALVGVALVALGLVLLAGARRSRRPTRSSH
jgi:hypothetical protein